VEIPKNVSNAYEIALLELAEKKIPFIIKRPYGNTFEYWKLKDLL
jgi:DNA-directed RNA polymerase subunit K/omega